MSTNKLYTLSYFRKRLLDSKIKSRIIIDKFSDNDSRYWSIIIDPNKSNIACTCYKKSSDEFKFMFQIPNGNTVSLKTLSMDVIINTINENKVFGGCDE
jgi:hypothetical protein